MKLEQEPKYDCDSAGRLINRHSGEAIPDDEPVFVFRARDIHAREALESYASVLEPGEHRDAVCQRIADFAKFSYAHPERMKVPDTAERPEAALSQEEIPTRNEHGIWVVPTGWAHPKCYGCGHNFWDSRPGKRDAHGKPPNGGLCPWCVSEGVEDMAP